ncbi:MAG: hypothetical protein ABI317_05190, partial [Gaiellales bacterium]
MAPSDVDIDLGRWAGRVISRWYIVLACIVVAAVIASLGSNSGHKVWTARALVNEGQPFSATNGPIAASLGTNPSAASTLTKQDSVVKYVAGKVGLKPAQLNAAISTQPIGQPNVKANYTPLVSIIVSGPWKTKVAPAANLLAQQFLGKIGAFQKSKLVTLTTLTEQEAAQLIQLSKRDKLALTVYESLTKATTGLSQFEKQLALNSALNLLNSIETRQQQLQAQHAQDLQTLDQVRFIESPVVVTRATATQTTAASKRAGYAVAILLG